jgi:hypothetical protein
MNDLADSIKLDDSEPKIFVAVDSTGQRIIE